MKKKMILIIIVLLLFYWFFSINIMNEKYSFLKTDLTNLGEEKVCNIVESIINDINKNKGNISKKYKNNIINQNICETIYCYKEFEKLNYDEIYAVDKSPYKDIPEYILLKDIKKSDVIKKVIYRSPKCVFYNAKVKHIFFIPNTSRDDITAGICVPYEDVLELKKGYINYDSYLDGGKKFLVNKGNILSLDYNELYIELKYNSSWVITKVEKRGKVDFKAMYNSMKYMKKY